MAKSGFIAIIGRPNAGKSTLLNQVTGSEISIVTPKAQTTRDRVLGILTEKRGQIVFIDTPGIHRAKEGGINEYMVGEAKQALEAPSLIWYLLDPYSELKHEQAVIELLNLTAQKDVSIFLVLNKVDKKSNEPLVKAIEEELKNKGFKKVNLNRISARSGLGVVQLVEASWSLLAEGPFYYPDSEQLSDRPTRFFVAEMIREQLLLQLGEEVPYSCAVEIESFKENLPVPRIEAVIYVERPSQKAIVIGAKGSKIKSIGQAARKKAEQFLEKKIFLGLQVKVLPDWTRDAETLRRMGYALVKREAS